ncbi:unnamed protein product [Orchesella dallaii]|uniref:Biogenesis of lysosome-related organelles complex 1 subunit 5 n=1 Tax=Orchesella dallaii TaxID=48710 RepID=A0ABP1PQK0_9HEXA
MAGGILKDIREIYSSIFDHKPVVHREVDFFLKEFEESRGDREVDRLFKILERVTELKDSEITKAKSLADIHIPKLSAELQVAESIADTLLDKRLKAEKDISLELERKRQERSVEWDTFVHDMTNKCIRIDNTFKEKEDAVRVLYKKAEEKLHQEQQAHCDSDNDGDATPVEFTGENSHKSSTKPNS